MNRQVALHIRKKGVSFKDGRMVVENGGTNQKAEGKSADGK